MSLFFKFISIAAGSKLEQVIGDGPEALNAFIDSGQIEELSDLIPQQEESDDASDNDDENSSDEPKEKRAKVIKNHNAQVIYKNPDANAPQSIPSLLQLSVPPENESPWSHPPPSTENWTAPPVFNQANLPPSLLNLNVAPPFEDSPNNWQQPGNNQPNFKNRTSNTDAGAKRRNRDSDGNRISRFDRERPSRFDNNTDAPRNNQQQRRNNRRI